MPFEIQRDMVLLSTDSHSVLQGCLCLTGIADGWKGTIAVLPLSRPFLSILFECTPVTQIWRLSKKHRTYVREFQTHFRLTTIKSWSTALSRTSFSARPEQESRSLIVTANIYSMRLGCVAILKQFGSTTGTNM
jgi:hypothetical protein